MMKQKMTQATFDKIVNDVKQMIDGWCLEDQQKFYNRKKEHLSFYHHNLGMYIRNTYRLWELHWTPELYGHGCDCSPNHPDNVSQRVIETVWELHHAS